jgi:4-hydroxy-tetrahydrodipicolinate synthase
LQEEFKNEMGNQKPIKGVLTLIPTPFDEKGELDLQTFKEHIEYLEAAGMHGIVVASSAGEFYTLNDDEFKILTAAARDSCKKMLCIVNCSFQNMRTTLERVKYAEEIGADCAIAYPYHYHQLHGSAQHYRYYQMINETTRDMRFMIFNDTRETKGIKVDFDLFTRLLEDFPRIVASVEDISNYSAEENIILTAEFWEFGSRLNILARSEAGMYPCMANGGQGCLATYGLAIPEFLLRLYDKCARGMWDEALEDHWTLTRYPWDNDQIGVNVSGRPSKLFPGTFNALISYTHTIASRKVGTVFPGTAVTCKAMAEASGRKVGKPRLPMLPPSLGLKDFAQEWLKDLGY